MPPHAMRNDFVFPPRLFADHVTIAGSLRAAPGSAATSGSSPVWSRAMTIASVAMALAFALAIVTAWAAWRLALHRASGLAVMIWSAVWAVANALLSYELFTMLTHGSELSNLGDGLMLVVVLPVHIFCWPIVAAILLYRSRRQRR